MSRVSKQKKTDTEPTPVVGFSNSTLGLLGPTLPIGVLTGNPPMLEKGFAFKPYRMKEERELDRIRNRKGGSSTHPGKTVLDVLAYMLTEWGGDPEFSSRPYKHRVEAIRNAFMADVLYAYVWLRCEAMGSVLGMSVTCPTCSYEWNWQTDLEGLEIEVVDRTDQLVNKDYNLGTSILFGENEYDLLEVQPPVWAAVCDIKQNARRGGVGDIKAKMIRSCVRQAMCTSNDKAMPVTMTTAFMDEMTKRDVESLAQFINDEFPSVDLSMLIECPSCGAENLNQVQWNWDFFFSSSSLPNPSRR